MDQIITIDVFSDVVCPWCYIGEKRLEQALAQRPAIEAEIRWRPFQLRPDMPSQGEDWRTFVDEKFGGIERAQALFAQVAAVGAEVGIEFNFARIASAANTADAHRLLLLAGRHGRQWELATALFKAHFTDGVDLNDHGQLVACAVAAGLEAAEVRAYLASDQGADEVRSSQREAGQLGVQGVPFYVFDERWAVSGAQPVAVFLRALDTAQAAGEREG
jgi:predicted DsbA family dithiol-disulfide isomerase